jgi:hypothetical protein
MVRNTQRIAGEIFDNMAGNGLKDGYVVSISLSCPIDMKTWSV